MGLTEVVAEDLAELTNLVGSDPTERALRRSSGVLRALLPDGQLGRAWRADGRKGEPKIQYMTMPEGLAMRYDRQSIVWASFGGAELARGGRLMGIRLGGGFVPHPDGRPPEPISATIGLSRYSDGVVAIARGISVKRSQLIKYVANKLGGIHYDEARPERDAESRVYKALDSFKDSNEIMVMGYSLIYWELLSIAQNVARSPDVVAWVATNTQASGS